MKYLLLLLSFFLFSNSAHVDSLNSKVNIDLKETEEEKVTLAKKVMAFDAYAESFYDCLNNKKLNYKMFVDGLKGYYSMKSKGKLTNSKYLTLVDYTLASNKNRIFIIDMTKKKLVKKNIIAHGKNSGGLYAKEFSNESESRMSSLGFFTTGVIYNGKYDYSLKLHGLEYSNNNVFERGVVMHSADYATKEFLKKNGNVLGRSFGCPVIPHKDYKKTVNLIKGGSCFFIYGKDKKYFKKSTYLKTKNFIDSFYQDFE